MQSVAGGQVADRRQIFDNQAFYRALSATRVARDMTWKEVADEASVSASTLTRMAQDSRPDADGLAALSAWSGLNPADFVYGAKAGSAESMAEITKVLRKDSRLDPEDATVLEEIVRAAYQRMLKKNAGS